MSQSETHKEILALHVPALHRGYVDLFDMKPSVPIGVFDSGILQDISYLRKDIRHLKPEQAVELLVGAKRQAFLLTQQVLLEYIEDTNSHLFLPGDDISDQVIQAHSINPSRYSLLPVFLRWDRKNIIDPQPPLPDRTISGDEMELLMTRLSDEMRMSPNWWRSVGAILKPQYDTILVSGHNFPLEDPYSHDILGDPRILAGRGTDIDISTDIHAEADVISQAARNGIALEGSDIIVSTFPCQHCAKLIASSGIKRCFYVDGYATLDGLSVLKQYDIEIIHIDTNLPPDTNRSYIPYPGK